MGKKRQGVGANGDLRARQGQLPTAHQLIGLRGDFALRNPAMIVDGSEQDTLIERILVCGVATL